MKLPKYVTETHLRSERAVNALMAVSNLDEQSAHRYTRKWLALGNDAEGLYRHYERYGHLPVEVMDA